MTGMGRPKKSDGGGAMANDDEYWAWRKAKAAAQRPPDPDDKHVHELLDNPAIYGMAVGTVIACVVICLGSLAYVAIGFGKAVACWAWWQAC